METKDVKPGQWWFASDGSGRAYIHGISASGIPVYELSTGIISYCDQWKDWHHEPRCTGWDWVVPAEPTSPVNQPDPCGKCSQPEDPDEWVVQDRVPIRLKIDRFWYMTSGTKLPENREEMWQKWRYDHFLDGKKHGDYIKDGRCTLHVMCRRRDLLKVEQPDGCRIVCQASKADGIICPHESCDIEDGLREAPKIEQVKQWPKYWKGTFVDGTAFVRQDGIGKYIAVDLDGSETKTQWSDSITSGSGIKELTEAEAMALLKKPASQPQPQKTRVRLWLEGPTKMIMCRNKAPYGDWQELHHDSKGFYIEDQQ